MKAKERLYAVIGGCVGAALTLVVCTFFPTGAQTQEDSFGEITCTGLKVIDPKNGTAVIELVPDKWGGRIKIRHTIDLVLAEFSAEPFGGSAVVRNIEGVEALMKGDADGGRISVSGEGQLHGAVMTVDEDSGKIYVFGNDTKEGQIHMTINEHGGSISVYGKDDHAGRAHLGVNEYGGIVGVSARGDSKGQAVMGVNEYGNGAVSTWDKNGYRQ